MRNTPKKSKILLYGLLSSVVIFALAFGIIYTSLDQFAQKNSRLEEVTHLRIGKGSGLKAIARALFNAGLIDNEFKFYWYTRLCTDASSRLQAGYYTFKPHMSVAELVKHLQFGREEEIRVTIPEGSTQESIAQILISSGLSSQEEINAALADEQLWSDFGIPHSNFQAQKILTGGMEGYLFPDTYLLPKSLSAKGILWQMHHRFKAMLPVGAEKRMKELGLNLHQIITLASLIEMEAASAEERGIISGVFYNRLKKNMKLQTDPSTVYGVTNYNGSIKKNHLLKKHPYNTYTNFGLPPGPISSPGQASIAAALWPAHHDYLYFVSKNDGTHEFCTKLTCHNAAVKKWQLGMRTAKRK